MCANGSMYILVSTTVHFQLVLSKSRCAENSVVTMMSMCGSEDAENDGDTSTEHHSTVAEESMPLLDILWTNVFSNPWDLACVAPVEKEVELRELELLVDWKELSQVPWVKYWPNRVHFLSKYLKDFPEIDEAISAHHTGLFDLKTGMSNPIPFEQLDSVLQSALMHNFHGGKYDAMRTCCRFETAGDAIVRLGTNDICIMTGFLLKMLGRGVPKRYEYAGKKETDIARIAQRNKIMAVIYDGIGLCELSRFRYLDEYADEVGQSQRP